MLYVEGERPGLVAALAEARLVLRIVKLCQFAYASKAVAVGNDYLIEAAKLTAWRSDVIQHMDALHCELVGVLAMSSDSMH
jgi:hypothetical protein